jgi:RNA polymerase sigma-70 factor, ECF subfamily
MPDWPAIVVEFGPLVWRTAYRLLGNDADASDCFQRTFLSAVEMTEPVRNWPGLLRRLATARAMEQLRQSTRTADRFAPLGNTPPVDRGARDPLDQAGAEELASRLKVALADIDPVQAEVFCLICLEELSYSDAAGQLGLTPNHVGVLLNRARAAVRERLLAFDPNREHLRGGYS